MKKEKKTNILSSDFGEITLKDWFFNQRKNQIFLLLCLLTIIYYFGIKKLFLDHSVFVWLWKTWNPHSGYEHARLLPIVFVFLFYVSWQKSKDLFVRPNNLGIFVILAGTLLLIIAVRAKQARVAVLALPFLFCGLAIYLCGFKISRKFYFTFFIIYFAIPLHALEQATNPLQIISSTIASKFVNIIGIGVTQAGNNITSVNENWGSFDISEGCSGIRSLMALSFIAAILAHLTQKKLWKKAVLFFSSLPIAIISNAFRIASIICIAQFFNPEFAQTTYHDWSGLLFFFPMGLLLLILCGNFLKNGKIFYKTGEKQIKILKK